MTALIGAIHATLSADTAKFEQGMRRAQSTTARTSGSINKSLGSIKSGFAGLAAGLSIGLFTRGIKNALDYAGSLAEVAQQVGVTAKDLQVLRFAGAQVGISTEQMDKGLQKFTKSLGDARNGSAEAIKTFKALGFTDQEIKKLDVHDALLKTADGIAKVGDRASRASPEVRLFGKAGQQLDTLLSQGSKGINALAEAAEKLGVVLSDEQIRNADDTADKLEALKTVLGANISAAVADNAQSILGLASSIGAVTVAITRFLGSNPTAAIALMGAIAGGAVGGLPGAAIGGLAGSVAGSQVDVPFNPAAKRNDKLLQHNLALARKRGDTAAVARLEARLGAPSSAAPPSFDLGNFLAGAGGGKKAKVDHTAEDRLRDSFQFDQQIRNAQMDVLRAQQSLAGNYIERTTIGIEILNAEKAARDAEHKYQIELFKLTKGKQGLSEAQVAQLEAEENITDSLERQALLDEEQAQRAEDVQSLTQADFDRRKDAFQSQLQIAETADERRKIELELLQIAYDQRRQALQNIIDTSKDIAAIENARRDLLNLKSTFGNDRQAVINDTRGPMEDFLASLPTTAAKANEALERLQVEGFNGLIDSVLALSEGVGSATDSLLDTLKNFFLGLARLELQKLLGSALGEGGFLSGLGFASGGFTGNISSDKIAGFVHGSEGVLNTRAMRKLGVPALNALNRGAPLSAVLNDNGPRMMGSRGDVYMTVVTPDADSFRRSEGQTTRGLRRKLA